MDSSRSKLTRLQVDLLDAFFRREQGFFLTGGAALAGYHLGHRRTDDLDLFALEKDAFERGRFALADAADELGATLEVRQAAPGFQRVFVARGDEGVVVDLVWERVPQLSVEKLQVEGVRLDPPEEILVNKLTTVASRCEVRDLVDLMLLERSGLEIEAFLAEALRKDGGCTAATLAWALSQITIPEGAEVPGEVSAAELRDYVGELMGRLRRAALPSNSSPHGP